MEKRIQAQLRAKKGVLAIARDLKVGTGTVQRVKREMEPAGPFDSLSVAAFHAMVPSETRGSGSGVLAAGEPHESRSQIQSRMGIRDRGGSSDHSRGCRRGDDIFFRASAGSGAASAGGRAGCSAHLGCARSLAADDSRHTGRGATADGTTGGQIACGSVSYPALGRVACSRCVGE